MDEAEAIDPQNAGWRQKLALGALALSIFSVLWFALAALGSKYGLWSWGFGLGTMTRSLGPFVGLGALGLAAVSLILALLWAPRKKPTILSLAALLISGGMVGRLAAMGAQAAGLPPIHDVQTDWSNPIMFSETLMKVREDAGAMNPVKAAPTLELGEAYEKRWPGMNGKSIAELQEAEEQDPAKGGSDDKEKLYPPINTLTVDRPKAEVLAAVKALVEKRGWEIVTEEIADTDETGVIEATETSGWYGFKDDVAIHVLTGPNGESIVDMRSVSRVGLSDLGANAKRVGNFMTDLRRVTAN